MRRGVAVVCLLSLLVAGCGDTEKLDPREKSYRACLVATTEARELLRARNKAAALETLLRAYELGRTALREDGERPRAANGRALS